MFDKRMRFGKLLTDPGNRSRYRDVHVFFGGTGAVGGTALLKMLELYEEMFACNHPEPEEVPVLVATGHDEYVLRQFTNRLFRALQARHGSAYRPRKVRSGYLTDSGIYVALEIFKLNVLQGLQECGEVPETQEREKLEDYLRDIGTSIDAEPTKIVAALEEQVRGISPLSNFLRDYARVHFPERASLRYRSVTLGIPLPSFVAYRMKGLEVVKRHVPNADAGVEQAKDVFEKAVVNDLQWMHEKLADEVVIAHTTGVGGMYDAPDEDSAIGRTRLGFAHSAIDTDLIEKRRRAERMSELYARAGVKFIITAAAIGIDEVLVDERVRLNRAVQEQLRKRSSELFPRPLHPPVVHVFSPREAALDFTHGSAVTFARNPAGEDDLYVAFQLRSGENGLLSVANAEALYRTMRVASMSELGLLIARIALFRDDKSAPWFDENGRCYYAETDNSRQVLDFLAQPMLRRVQLSGLEPMALVDLGSAKHQAELHTLALLILLHRLRTLDLDALPAYGGRSWFQPSTFFEEKSRLLTFEDLDGWDLEETARDLSILVSANEARDLIPLVPFPPAVENLFPGKELARLDVLKCVLRAVWTIPCLGSPFIYERDAKTRVRTGYYVAPLDLLVDNENAVARSFRSKYDSYCETVENPTSFAEFRDRFLAAEGFIDLRPHAILTDAWSEQDLRSGGVRYARSEAEMAGVLASLPPYTFFSTCGLLAILYRLRGLYRYLSGAMLELGTFQDARWQMPRDENGHLVVVPGIVEGMRMVAEGLEKVTGAEFLDGPWGYGRRPIPDRSLEIDLD